MGTLEKIINTIKSYDGRKKRLEQDDKIDFDTFCKKTDELDLACMESIRSIIEIDERSKKGP
jgi:hypothetical protein